MLPALRGAMLPAGHSCFHCCGHWPPISHQPSHWPQTGLPRPPIGASGSTGRRRAGTKQTWPWQGPTTNSCTLQTVTRSPSLMRIGCATLVLRIALAKEKAPPQKLFCGKQPLQCCMSSTLVGQRPLFASQVMLTLIFLAYGWDSTSLLLAFWRMHLICFFSPQGAFSICITQVSKALFIKLKPQWSNFLHYIATSNAIEAPRQNM